MNRHDALGHATRGLLLLVALVALSRCGGVQSSAVPPALRTVRPASAFSKIQHVVIIFQENRSVDDLFNGFPGADTVREGLNAQGKEVPLRPVPLTAPWDLDHTHGGFVTEYDGGKMDGFSKDAGSCFSINRCIPSNQRAYGYVPRAEAAPYFTMGLRYAFADRMFQTNEGPSFPAHQYIISGTSAITNDSPLKAAEQPSPAGFASGGCDSPEGSLVLVIDPAGNENQSVFPCFDRIALMDLVEAKSLSWTYYQAQLGPGIWNAPDAVLGVRKSPQFATDVVAPPTQVLKDVANGKLANVVWVTPAALWSDHAQSTNGSGPSWVAAVVNAIGKSQYWKNTAIFVTWDDWGGWYDHVPPPQYNSYELGFRVPLIVISPYAKTHYVSHVQHEFGSILKFTEKVFGLGSLHTTDVRADDLSDCFDFDAAPAKFRPIPAPYSAAYFLKQAPDTRSPDDDAPDYAAIYSFGQDAKSRDGRVPAAALAAVSGAFYGTTEFGGATNARCSVGCGALFHVTTGGKESVIYRFSGGSDGAYPAAGVIETSGTLYGTTGAGGSTTNCTAGCGTVYRVDVGTGRLSTLYRFAGATDGSAPVASLLAAGGALYGTTQYGGDVTRLCSSGCGTVFKIDLSSGGEKVLYAFKGSSDGSRPISALIDVGGTLYGTTQYGGRRTPYCELGCGTVFAIDAASGTLRVIYRFDYSPASADGAFPAAGVVAAGGTLYGTTLAGGTASQGTVFEVSPAGSERVLHDFSCCTNGRDGVHPVAPLLWYSGGLYGTTSDAGQGKKGTVFSLTPSGTENVIYNFEGEPDGARPVAGVIALDGKLYGTTSSGGRLGEGTVFMVSP